MRRFRLASIILCGSIVARALIAPPPPPAFADSGLCATPGKDGPGGVLSGIVNTYYPGAATVAAGSTSIPVGAPSGAATPIAAGDLLLVIQMQDADIDSTNTSAYGDGVAGDPATGWTNLNNAGRYEYVIATGPVAAGSVPILGAGAGGGLVYTYTNAAATAAQGQRRYQVVRVPQYSSATLSSGLTALAWDGRVGGILALDVAGQLTLGGTVSVSGLGFRGGGGRQAGGSPGYANTNYRTPSTANPNGSKGEGIAGTPRLVYDGISVVNTGTEGYPNGAMARGAPGNAGGGGTDGRPSANDQNSGGGGGGNGGAGGRGGFTWNTVLNRGGHGGSAFTAAAPNRLVMGGGGGAGTRNNTPNIPAAASGGPGGGIVMVRAGTLVGSGGIAANGGVGVVPENDGSGGGGAGGTVLLVAQTWSPTSLTVSAAGGAGTSNWITMPPGTPGEFTTGSANNRHGPGGGGGGGVVFLSSAANTTTVVTGGANGTTTTAGSAFGAQPGSAGIVRTNVTPAELTTGIAGAPCLPVVATTKTTSTPSVTNGPGGTAAQYTITVSNAAGRGTAINLRISDALPSGFAYASTTSVVLGGGASRSPIADPTPGDTTPVWGDFTLPGGGSIAITFTVTIASSVPDGTYQNPAAATYSDPVRTDPDGTTSAAYDPASSTNEDVTVSSPPNVVAKGDVLLIDDGDGVAEPGETLEYTILITNNGWEDGLDVVFSDTPDPNTALLVGSVTTTQGTITSGNNPGDSSVGVSIGTLAARGGSVTITFRVTINNPLPAGVVEVSNQGTVSGSNFPATPTDDPDTAPAGDPTVTPVVAAPDLAISKSDGGATAIPGATISYTLTYRNVGNQGATGVTLTDLVPPNTTFNPAASTPGWTCVPDNNPGSACTFTIASLDGGGASGTVTFALTVADPLPPGVSLVTNTATITDDAANGPDPDLGNNTDTDTTPVLQPGDLAKSIAATSQAHTGGSSVAIGEIVTYRVRLNVPPGTMADTTLTDTLEQGLGFVECVAIYASSGISTDLPGGVDAACDAPTNPTVSAVPPGSPDPIDQGRQVVFSLGDVTNAGGTSGTIEIDYRAVVLDALPVVRGVSLSNAVLWEWEGGALSGSGPAVTAVEPSLTLVKAASPTVALPGSSILFTLSLAHEAASDSDAFDLVLRDLVPPGLTYVPGSLAWTGVGLPPTALDDGLPTVLTARWDTFPLGARSEIRFQAVLGALAPGQQVINRASLEWTSLPDDNVQDPFSLSPFNALSTERFYDPGSEVNIYQVSATATITVLPLPPTGFAPGRITRLPPAPQAAPYTNIGQIWLRIPRLGVLAPVVGIPANEAGWDVAWLWNQAGYLEGTAFPTLSGNTALTAHVYLSDGTPGPFVNLKDLIWGDRIYLDVGGLRYVYEVRQVTSVRPHDLSPLRHEDLDWLTLITCQGYDPGRDAYRWRLAVRAVRISVER